MVINLIATPRNISTGIMYSFAQRKDLRVFDEPWYAAWLLRSGADHPGREETIASQPHSSEEVVQWMKKESEKYPHIFIKNMAKHLDGLDTSFLDAYSNIFLIRDPKQLIASFAQVIPNPTEEEIGMVQQYSLFKKAQIQSKHHVVILDSGELLKSPEVVLRKLCNTLGIPFAAEMLFWEAGPREEDGVWAPYWYANVHRSTGFEVQVTSHRPLPVECEPLYAQIQPLYEEMYSHAIKA